ncbi:VOC family protein [Fibrobacter succinogenes]|uniref:VOC family protein n=1 Tax=Fibrobacter succinogenes TaxID=833 RepID=UPI001568193C|nr:VOC family protein [Fibrobacter succinogenes]
MKIEHIAIWVKDIDRVCEFYRKYFGGVVQPLYHNPTKQFTSRFISFDDGARLEVMHRPDIDVERNVGIDKIVSHETLSDTQHLGFTHLSFSVGSKEEVDRLTQQMSSEGIPVVGQPRTTGDGYYESVVLDPEGNRIEITV